MITLARLKLLPSQKPGDEKNAYLLLSLTLLDYSSEHLVSEDVTDSKFHVRPRCTVEKKLLYPFMLSHGTLLMHCSCKKKKNLHVSSRGRPQREVILSTENLISDIE